MKAKDIELREENRQYYEDEDIEDSKSLHSFLVEEMEVDLNKDNKFAQMAEELERSQKVFLLVLKWLNMLMYSSKNSIRFCTYIKSIVWKYLNLRVALHQILSL